MNGMNYKCYLCRNKTFCQILFWLFPLLNILWVYLFFVGATAIDYLSGDLDPWQANVYSLADCFVIKKNLMAISYYSMQIVYLLIDYGYVVVLHFSKRRHWILPFIYLLCIMSAATAILWPFPGESSMLKYVGDYLYVFISIAPSIVIPYLLKLKLDSFKHHQ